MFTFCDFYVFNFTALSVMKISILSENRDRGIFVIRYWHGVCPITGTYCISKQAKSEKQVISVSVLDVRVRGYSVVAKVENSQ